MGSGIQVSAQDTTTLGAIEEAFHRYQIRALGMSAEGGTLMKPEHPLEQPIPSIIKKAIKDMSMAEYSF